jgi:hypothetical protein
LIMLHHCIYKRNDSLFLCLQALSSSRDVGRV